MQVGGNAAAAAYFRSHGCTTKEAHAKYNSRAANMYKEKLSTLASSTQRMYGTQVGLLIVSHVMSLLIYSCSLI
jgi:ADP-ribosylation factor GTPase-activating protein 2/3